MRRNVDYVKQRWEYLISCANSGKAEVTSEDVVHLVYSSWLDEITTERVAYIARVALVTDKTYAVVAEKLGITKAYVANCVRRVGGELILLNKRVSRGMTTFAQHMDTEVTLDSIIYLAVINGVCSRNNIRYIEEQFHQTFRQLEERCVQDKRRVPKALGAKYTNAECVSLCKVCQAVHQKGGERCPLFEVVTRRLPVRTTSASI